MSKTSHLRHRGKCGNRLSVFGSHNDFVAALRVSANPVPNTHSVNRPSLKQVRAAAFLERIKCWIRNIPNLPTKWAVTYLCRQLRRDPDYRESWQANIAMTIYDSSRRQETLLQHDCGWKSHIEGTQANHIADRLMKHLFGA